MILIVDDDPSVIASLSLLLKQSGRTAYGVSSPAEAVAWLDEHACELVVQDMNFSRRTTGEEGLGLLRTLRQRHPRLPVILMTAWGSIGLAVEGMKAGASDFVTKPWTHPQVVQAVEMVLGLAAAEKVPAEKALTREELDHRYDFDRLIGEDPGFLRMLQIAGRVSATDAAVLIVGESGTGKELVAEAIHRNSPRRRAPFVKVNLGGISPTFFESEMFGHLRGAFTDAKTDRKGRFDLAEGGTIFLDEIGELDPACQVKMLRVLQDRTYEALGSSTSKTVDVRVISATNRNLADLVRAGVFREDLLYRLNLITLQLPPLRERPQDVPRLATRFLAAAAEMHKRDVEGIAPDAIRWLQSQAWPGNVRQLRHWIERAVLVGSGSTIGAGDIEAAGAMEIEAGARGRDELPAVGSMTIDQIEKAMIVKSLRHHDGNITRVAEALGLSRAALYRRFEKYGIHV
jgi:two-component system, NtrC family, response regulator